MKRFLFIILALLMLVGVANAASIPGAVAPYNYPEIWTTEVYNNSGGDLVSGSVVVWDFNSVSTPAGFTDRLNYVTTTTTADDIRVAGVLTENCLTKGTCTICIRGPVYALVGDSIDAVTASYAVGTTVLAGQCGQEGSAAVNKGILGWAISAAPNTAANGGNDGTDGGNNSYQPIFVNPSNN
jgi:hypothetical protein